MMIKSMREFDEMFFPMEREKKINEEMMKDPLKYGEHMANKAMKRIMGV